MYPETSPTTPVEINHGHALAAVDQAAARPCRTAQPKIVGYARTLLDPADLRAAVSELHQLGVHSENIYLDRDPAGGRGRDDWQLALQGPSQGSHCWPSDRNQMSSSASLHEVTAAARRERRGMEGSLVNAGQGVLPPAPSEVAGIA